MQDAEHLKLLSVFHYVLAALTALVGFLPIIYIALGAAMVMGKMPAGPSSPAPPAEFGWMFIIFGGLFCLLAWAFAVCLFLSGRWLAARRNWTFCFVVACLSCMNVPLGTILGVFTILVLQRPGMKGVFGLPLPGGYLNR